MRNRQNQERKNPLDFTAVFLFTVTGLGYMMSYLFDLGYQRYFGVPEFLIEVGSVSSVIKHSIYGVIILLMGLMLFSFSPEKFLKQQVSKNIVWIFFIGASEMILLCLEILFRTVTYLTNMGWVGWIIIVVILFGIPLLLAWFTNKPGKDSLMIKFLIRIKRYAYVVIIFIVIGPLAYALGSIYGSFQKNFYVIEEKNVMVETTKEEIKVTEKGIEKNTTKEVTKTQQKDDTVNGVIKKEGDNTELKVVLGESGDSYIVGIFNAQVSKEPETDELGTHSANSTIIAEKGTFLHRYDLVKKEAPFNLKQVSFSKVEHLFN
ncbi:hypothetical protein AM501_24075 [Aneurinibacillus migulanus]|uniref:hypothetical protein n=1 Tax=Aneurinibacillus migulanus TaxID=47500 RepID=UPI0005BA3346|nr:hypothetical protein [Aneurinibacillus migulanus]KIV58913.1 hypothetical protein TS64_03905 [Aneurinibacillus migulanus]KPD05855.1 hypothetical protein AM501_24075 [Aneurinibacillus migulanus]